MVGMGGEWGGGHMPVVSVFGRQGQENQQFEASLEYVRPCFKKKIE